MQTVKFMAYAVTTGYELHVGSEPFEHAFVVSEKGDNWGCYGRGQETIGHGARPLPPDGVAIPEWARLLYGDPAGPTPTGLLEKVEGVCQNVANRILVLAGTDVSAANGNIFATLLYGKYGFHVDDYVLKVKQTADQLNSKEPGAVTEAALQKVLDAFGEDPSDELRMLESHFQGVLPQTITPQQNDQLLVPYREFQAKRKEIFDQEWPNKAIQSDRVQFQKQFAALIAPSFIECLHSFAEILGAQGYEEVFKAPPEKMIGYLLRI
jgi:hypothetical protein